MADVTDFKCPWWARPVHLIRPEDLDRCERLVRRGSVVLAVAARHTAAVVGQERPAP
jgi:hypothetical protein